MIRGFLWTLFRPAFTGEAWGSKTPREVWLECLRRSVGTFRKFNPRENTLVLDVHGMLSADEKKALGCQVVQTPITKDWPSRNWCKVMALGLPFFDETCLVDLDFHFCGPIGDVFDKVTEPIGALAYPLHSDPMRRINTGLTVCKDKAALRIWGSCYVPEIDDDEVALWKAVAMGRMRVTLLPDTYGRMYDNRPGGTWMERGWQADQAETGALAFHWQGRKDLLATDAGIASLIAIG
jgi:hypothetical protein